MFLSSRPHDSKFLPTPDKNSAHSWISQMSYQALLSSNPNPAYL
jgi:hypothetical protein